MAAATPPPIAGLLRALVADPGRPRLTWYGPGGERIELSGHVLDNWVTKTTNLLVEEYDAGPGTHVLLDLPAHWRTVVWATAVWRAGACVVLPAAAPAPAPDVVVTHRPVEWSGGGADLVAVALPALARSVEGPLPPGAIDASAAVMTYGDALTGVPEADPGAPALVTQAGTVTHAALLEWARSVAHELWPGVAAAGGSTGKGAAGGPRVLLEPRGADPLPVLAAVLSAYAEDGSVVLCDPEVVRTLAGDPPARERLVAGERVSSGAADEEPGAAPR